MMAITFDTHTFVKKLTKAGMPEPQAEILAEEHTQLIENSLATKKDLKILEADLNVKFAELKASINSTVIKWIVSVAGIQLAYLSFLKLFH